MKLKQLSKNVINTNSMTSIHIEDFPFNSMMMFWLICNCLLYESATFP